MKIKDFIEECVKQIDKACIHEFAGQPELVEFKIQINAKGEVCSENDVAVAAIKITI